jgi:thiol-disulfide isomerase/thioredoxin
MRTLALALTLAAAVAVSADEPAKPQKRNPFRDAAKAARPEPAAKPETPDPVKNAPKVLRAAEVGVGKFVSDVAFTDTAGKAGRLSDLKGAKLTVVAFTNTTCPISKKYTPSLARIEKEYAAKGVAFLFVNPTATDKPEGIAFAGRYVHDTDGKLTAAFGATSTAEVFVLDSARTVLYRGAIDDQYGLGYALDRPRTSYLTAALDDALAGRTLVTAATTAPGCALEPDAAKATPIALTYHARIERIVQANCVECHRKGGVAPFALEKYEDVVAHKGMIRRVADAGTMPPWFAETKAGHSPFANDRSLTAADKKDLLAWLSGDLKKGDPADAPLPRKFDSGWLIGKPDTVFQIPEPIAVKAEGVMPYQYARIDTDFAEDRWVRSLEVQPTARDVVHHVLVFAVPKGQRGPGSESKGFFAAYAPGNGVLMYPEGYAKRLPKGYSLVFQIHYTPNGKATADQSKLAVVFADGPPLHEVHTFGIANVSFSIKPGDPDKELTARAGVVGGDITLLSFFPHAHLRGKAARYDLTAGGKTSPLLNVPHYDFNWQLPYQLAEPVVAREGSTIVYTARYDNSTKNPANPDPTKEVNWGEQTFDEMHLGYVDYVSNGSGRGRLGNPPRPADFKFPKGGLEIPRAFRNGFKAFDKNGNNVLDQDEFDALPPAVREKILDFAWRISPTGG